MIDSSTPTSVFTSFNVASNAFSQDPLSSILSGNNRVYFEFRVPVAGWSSQVQMSSDTDTQVVAAAYQTSSGQTFSSGGTTKVTFQTKLFDTHSAFATDTYTVPVSGKYRVSANFRVTPTSYSAATNQVNISLYKNGSGYADLDLS